MIFNSLETWQGAWSLTSPMETFTKESLLFVPFLCSHHKNLLP